MEADLPDFSALTFASLYRYKKYFMPEIDACGMTKTQLALLVAEHFSTMSLSPDEAFKELLKLPLDNPASKISSRHAATFNREAQF